MARFDVFANPGQHSATTPYVVEVQSDLLDGLHTTVVIPLRWLDTMSDMAPPERLMPVFDVGASRCFWRLPSWPPYPAACCGSG